MARPVEARMHFVRPCASAAGRSPAGQRPVCISPNTGAHLPPHWERPPPRPHPSVNRYRDKSPPPGAVPSTQRDRTRAARSARRDQKHLHNPVLRSSKSPASGGPRSSESRIPTSSAVDPNPHCEESALRGARRPAPPPSRKSARAPDGGARWEKVPAAHDNRLRKGWSKARSRQD